VVCSYLGKRKVEAGEPPDVRKPDVYHWISQREVLRTTCSWQTRGQNTSEMFEFIDKIHILFFPTFKNTCGIRRHKAWNHVLSRRDNKYGISENSNTEKRENYTGWVNS
jgi:hypothetical protein